MPRGEIMYHMQEDNLALCVGRQGSVTGSNNYDIVFVSENIVDYNLFRRGGELVFPLYLYQKTEQKKKSTYTQLMMFEPDESYLAVRPNISRIVFEELKKNYKKEPTPEEIFYYVYAILYSKTYRTKYAEFLKIDFPYVPFTKNYKLFISLVRLGNHLIAFHLLKARELEKTAQIFSINGNNEVDKLKYEDEKVWINQTQYFNNIKEEVWQYQVGGYQVCEKWLKDKKGRTLTYQEIQTYSKIVTALSKTIDLQTEIDKLYESVEKTLLE
jgi:predicted helicase